MRSVVQNQLALYIPQAGSLTPSKANAVAHTLEFSRCGRFPAQRVSNRFQ
jgi:hypothetical protein